MKILFLIILVAVFSQFSLPAQNQKKSDYLEKINRISAPLKKLFYPKNLVLLEKCYPKVDFNPDFDLETMDWKIILTANDFENRSEEFLIHHKNQKKQTTLYWAEGKMLPKSELKNKNDFWPLQYKYENRQRDPKNFTAEEIENIKDFASNSNRRTQAGTPMFFFDFVYSANSKFEIENHIIQTTFLGKRTRIHERIFPQIKKIEQEILQAAKTDSETKKFIDELKSSDAYYWRQIAGTSRKSFHSYGISIDVLPQRLYGKAIYWSWEKDRAGNRWMLTPLEKRWTPGEKVIKIFEDNGFIWGGNWIIFDNMHFEYHPELTATARKSSTMRQ